MKIHPLAVVHPKASLGHDVEIGPFCVVEEGVSLGAGTRLANHVVIRRGTVLGRDNRVHEGAVLGGDPQHISPPGPPGGLILGDSNAIREHVTIHRSLQTDGFTRIGNGCLLMVGSHVAHDCALGDHVILTNDVLLAGHIEVGDRAYFGGGAAAHQFCRIGSLAMVGGHASVKKDVPPYVTLDGETGMVVGLNRVGLRRNGYTQEQVDDLKRAYRILYRQGLNWNDALETLRTTFPTGPAAAFHQFVCQSKRGVSQERRTPPGATIRLVRDDDGEGEAVSKAG